MTREVERLIAEQNARASSFDSRAGLILAFCGVLIGVSTGGSGGAPELLRLGAQLTAAAAAAFAVAAVTPRVSGALQPRGVRNGYLSADVRHTKLRLLDTKVWVYELDERRIMTKVGRLRLAIMLLAAAVFLILVGSAVEILGGE